MKILYYNWVDYLDAEDRGGGVSYYQRNLMKVLREKPGVEAWFLSSGISFDLFSAIPRWEKIRHGTSDDPRRYEIINSGVLSPSRYSFGNPAQVSHDPTRDAFFDFLETNGPFDVIHFNNLEGIPAEILELKQQWPKTCVILSLHNYYAFCPQVNLWHQEKEHCADFGDGDNCRFCIPLKPDERTVRLAGAVAFNMKKFGCGPGTVPWNRGFGLAMRIARWLVRLTREARITAKAKQTTIEKNGVMRTAPDAGITTLPHPASEFRERRKRMLELINRNCDHVLGVSERVSKIAEDYGVDPALVKTAYIGTLQYQKFFETSPRTSLLDTNGMLTLAFLGYMRRDKGYFFLIKALKALPKNLAARIRLVLAAPLGGDSSDLRELSEHLHEVIYSDGYNHDQLDSLLADVSLGVIPVLWEDNLPQVAIEMHARHIPLLTSDRGGARELGNYEQLVFEAGSAEDFADRIRAALDGEIDLERYWKLARPPVSLDEHIEILMDYYRE